MTNKTKAKDGGTPTFVRMDDDLRGKLKALAAKDRRPLSTYIRVVLEDHVARSKAKAKSA